MSRRPDAGDGDEAVVASLDCRGLLCPLPARETRRALAALASGDVLRVVCTDPVSMIDLRALCDETGDEILEARAAAPLYLFRIRKR